MHRRAVLAGLAATAGVAAAPGALAQAKPGRWMRLESANFIVYSSASEEKTRKELAALEGFHALMVKLMPRKTFSILKLTVYMTANDRDFKATAPWASSEVAGFYASAIEEVRAVSNINKSFENQRLMPKHVRAMDARVVLLHEYVHHYIRANDRVTYPAWYNEGIAEFLSTADFVDDGVLIGKFTMNRAIWLNSGTWLNIETFLTKPPLELSRSNTSEFYAQAWLATHYIFRTPERSEGFDRYVKALHEGGDPLGAFQPAFGITPQEFDREVKAYKGKPIVGGKIMDITAKDVEASLVRLPVSADELMMPMSHLRSVPPREEVGASISTIRAQAKKHAGDPFATRALALTEVWYGDLAEARKLLDGLVAAEPQNAEVLHLSGLCDLRMAYANADEALFKRARGQFTAAHRIDGTRGGSLYRYVECVWRMNGKIDQHLLDVLAMAYGLAPQVRSFALATAQALMEHGMFKQASNVLRPLIGDSHGDDTAFAKELAALAQAEKKPERFRFPASAATLEQASQG
jgi:hypothetical protein